jgi:hypothetical protein
MPDARRRRPFEQDASSSGIFDRSHLPDDRDFDLPGVISSFLIFWAMSLAIRKARSSETFWLSTMIRISRPA